MQVDCQEVKYFPEVSLQVEGYWLQISAEDYLVEYESKCVMGFMPNQSEFWLLGDSFFRGYYVVHDDENSRLGVAPHSQSSKSQVAWSQQPSTKLPVPFHLNQQEEIALFLLSLISVYLFFRFVMPKLLEWWVHRKDDTRG